MCAVKSQLRSLSAAATLSPSGKPDTAPTPPMGCAHLIGVILLGAALGLIAFAGHIGLGRPEFFTAGFLFLNRLVPGRCCLGFVSHVARDLREVPVWNTTSSPFFMWHSPHVWKLGEALGYPAATATPSFCSCRLQAAWYSLLVRGVRLPSIS